MYKNIIVLLFFYLLFSEIVCKAVRGADITETLNHYEAYLKTLDCVDFRYEIPVFSEKGEVRRGKNNIRCLIRKYKEDQLLSLTEMSSFDGNGIIYRWEDEKKVGRLTSMIHSDKNDYAVDRLFDFPFIFGFFPITETVDVQYLPTFFRSGDVSINSDYQGDQPLFYCVRK